MSKGFQGATSFHSPLRVVIVHEGQCYYDILLPGKNEVGYLN